MRGTFAFVAKVQCVTLPLNPPPVRGTYLELNATYGSAMIFRSDKITPMFFVVDRDWLLRSLMLATLNAFPLRSPRGIFSFWDLNGGRSREQTEQKRYNRRLFGFG